MNQSNTRFPAVDGVRAMAMLMVFWYHAWQFAGTPRVAWMPNQNWGGAGVDVFMVLSGFCLFFPFCVSPDGFDVRIYAARRIRRIVPPYYAAILFAIALRQGAALFQHLRGKQDDWLALPSAFDVLTHLTFTHTLFGSTFYGITGAFWSLGLEAQFYAAFPLVLWLVARFGTRSIWALVAVSLSYHAVIHFAGYGGVFAVQSFFLGRWMQFALGMMGAAQVAKRTALGLQTPTLAGAGLLALSAVLYFVPKPDFAPLLSQDALRALVVSIAVGALLLSVCTSTRPVHFVWSNRFSAGLGLMSYSFFLIHQPILQYLAQFLELFGPKLRGTPLLGALVVAGFPLCLALSYGFFVLVEKRFLSAQKPITK